MKDRSEVWEHFVKKETPCGLRAVCKYCNMEYKCNPKKSGTSPLWAHINRCRKYPYNTPKDSKQSLLSFDNANVNADGTSGLTYHKYDPGRIRHALSFMVIVDELPFKFVEGVGFKHFCNVIEPRFHVPSRITVAKDCFQIYLTEKRKLKNVLKTCNSRVPLTTDSWTSIQQINYMCLTVHFIDNNWKLQKRILNFCPISSHKGEEVGKEVEKCLLDWELEKIFCITVDNASSNDTAIGYLRRKINGWKSGVLKGKFIHMRYVAHIINLVVSDGLKIVNESVTRVRHAVRFIKQSPARLLRFKKCVSEEKINTKKLLCLDVPTRWNSTYLMLSAAIELEGAFERYSEEDPHYVIELSEREGKGKPEYEDWSNVKRFAEFLQAFYDLTLRVSGSLFVTSNLFFHELVNVALMLKELVSSDDIDLCLMAGKMKDKYQKYWGDPEKMNMIIFIAVVLDPRYKLDYVEWMISEIYDTTVASCLVSNLKEALHALYVEYRASSSNDVNVREEVSSSKDQSNFSPKHNKINTKKLLCLDVPTRWNSIYLILSAAIELEGAFERYSEEDPHYVIELSEREGKGKPEYEDWSNVKRFAEFLQAFYDLTLRVSGSLFVTSNLFFHELVNVALMLKELVSSDDIDLCLMAEKMKDKYQKYWGDSEKMNMIIFIAVVLDPRYKLDYVEWMISEIYDTTVASCLVSNLKEALHALYVEYRASSSNDVNVREKVSSSKDQSNFSPKHNKIEALKSKYKKQKFEKEGDAKIELDKYLDEDTENDNEDFDILGWWMINSSRFPTMGRMAKDVLAVPISTVASESAFSTGGRFLDPFRSSLSPRVVEGLVCAQNWLRSSPFPNIEECLEEVERLEEDLGNMALADEMEQVNVD